jgi:hypothetical protein
MTAVEQLYKEISRLIWYSRCTHKNAREATDLYKDLEREQHQRTWDAAIEAYISRGVKERAIVDFDDYEIK